MILSPTSAACCYYLMLSLLCRRLPGPIAIPATFLTFVFNPREPLLPGVKKNNNHKVSLHPLHVTTFLHICNIKCSCSHPHALIALMSSISS